MTNTELRGSKRLEGSRRAGVIILGLVMASLSVRVAPAQAQSAPDCAAATTTVDLVACAQRDFQTADTGLNAAYKRALDAVRGHDAPPPNDAKAYETALRAAQRAWVAYRDADCKGVVPFAWSGGQGAETEILGCLTAKTEARTRELLEAFGQDEGASATTARR